MARNDTPGIPTTIGEIVCDGVTTNRAPRPETAAGLGGRDIDWDLVDRDVVRRPLLTHENHLFVGRHDGAFALSGARKNGPQASRWREVDALLAGEFLEVVPVAVGEVALVATVPTDCAGVVLG